MQPFPEDNFFLGKRTSAQIYSKITKAAGENYFFACFDHGYLFYDSLDVLAMDERVKRGYCATWQANRRVISLLSLAEMAGMSTGIVTTTRVTHATPASAFAHSVDRDWESDSEKEETAKDDATSCKDIGKPVISS